jgi:hypothetical protein
LIKEVFIREGVVFIDENGGGAGIRLRKSGKEKSPKQTDPMNVALFSLRQ